MSLILKLMQIINNLGFAVVYEKSEDEKLRKNFLLQKLKSEKFKISAVLFFVCKRLWDLKIYKLHMIFIKRQTFTEYSE